MVRDGWRGVGRFHRGRECTSHTTHNAKSQSNERMQARTKARTSRWHRAHTVPLPTANGCVGSNQPASQPRHKLMNGYFAPVMDPARILALLRTSTNAGEYERTRTLEIKQYNCHRVFVCVCVRVCVRHPLPPPTPQQPAISARTFTRSRYIFNLIIMNV